jgi:hypothetical protein
LLIATAAAAAVYVCILAVASKLSASKHGMSQPNLENNLEVTCLPDANAAAAAGYVCIPACCLLQSCVQASTAYLLLTWTSSAFLADATAATAAVYVCMPAVAAELSASKHGMSQPNLEPNLEVTCLPDANAAAAAVYVCMPAVAAELSASKHGICPPH